MRDHTRVAAVKNRIPSFLRGWGLRRFAVVRALLALARPRTTFIQGHYMHLDAHDAVVSRDLADGSYEPFETIVLQDHIVPETIVLDIGANIGYYTLLMARKVGTKGTVHAFEPAPRTIALLKKNITANAYTNVVVHECAVGDSRGEVELFLNEYNAGDNRLYASEGMTSVRVPIRPIDELVTEKERVSFVKIDVQGYEWHALSGMKEILTAARPAIILELSPKSLARSGASARQLLTFLTAFGYSFQELQEDGQILVPVSLSELLTSYPDTEDRFTNILCTAS